MSKQRKCLLTVGSFLIPVSLFAIVMFLCKIRPFGNETLLLWDSDGQYLAMLTYFRRVLLGEADAFYSFDRALGGSMAGLISYYAASPCNLLLVLFPEGHMIDAFHALVVLRIGLCGLSSWYALNRFRPSGAISLLFSTAYALTGYMACYFWDIMWIDGLVLLPLIATGIRAIVTGKSALPYCLWLALALWSNYYIGYMLCLFSVLWFAYQLFLRLNSEAKPRILKSCLSFACSSLLAGGLASAMLFPAFGSLKSLGNAFTLSIQPRFPMLEIATKIFTGSISYDQLRYGLPNIYVGLPVLAFVGCYAFNRSIPRLHRIASATLIGIFLLSFQTEALYMLWHGLDAPNAMPARFSFLFCWVLIDLAYNACCSLDKTDRDLISSRMGFLALAFFAGTCLLFASGIPDYLAYETVVFDVVCFFLACGLIVLLCTRHRRAATIALCLIQAAGLIGNSYFAIHRLDFVHELKADQYTSFEANRLETVEKISAQDNGLYRMEANNYRVENDPLVFGYHGLSHFSSDFDPDFAEFMRQLGIYQSYYRIQYAAGTTPFLESLFGLKYLILDESYSLSSPPDNYELLWTQGNEGIWKNPNALSFAFVVPASEQAVLDSPNPFENQNRLAQDLSGVDVPVFLLRTPEVSEHMGQVDASFELLPNQLSYLYADGAWFSLNNAPYEKLGRFSGCVKLPSVSETSLNTLSVYLNEGQSNARVCLADWDQTAFDQVYQALSEQSCLVESTADSHLLIRMPAYESASQLLLTLPYDKGWHAYVDGEKVPVTSRYQALLAINLPDGAQQVELRFIPSGLNIGLTISGLSTLALLAWLLLNLKKRYTKKQTA